MPESFSERIASLRGSSSRKDFAETLGIHANTLGNYERGERTPDVEFAALLCRKLDISPRWLLTGEGPMRGGDRESAPARVCANDTELVLVPMVQARLAAGTGSFETGGEVEGRYAFRTEFLSRKGSPAKMVLMRVTGDSMEPDIKNDDVVLIDRGQRQPTPGQVFAVGIEDLVYLKMVDTLPGKLILKSANPAYPPIEVDARGDLENGMRIIGRVIWVGRELR